MEDWHGTAGGYTNHRCRCDPCRLSWNAYCSERRRRARGEYRFDPRDEHGTEKSYRRGCTCRKCKSAHAAYAKQLREGQCSRDGVCEICRQEGKVVWDHEHASGRHRGWLCILCNQAIGLAQDDPRILSRMEDYLL